MANIINSKIKSKSQQYTIKSDSLSVVANIINSKIKSKSQRSFSVIAGTTSCGKYHKFKDQKQITTGIGDDAQKSTLWQIS